MIIGTAGHIDHGKTALVKALTGVDADRLREEKERGITIDLGFAYAPLPNGEILGFVDVPGHEKFIHNMLAGASGIGFGLLVVAADDGVMPQTLEHLQILDLLGIRRGAVALTKIDRVERNGVDEVAEAVAELLKGTSLEGSPIFPVSAPKGTGIEELRTHLQSIALKGEASGQDVSAGFRLAVDRCFSLAGVGTVVTGTVFSGSVSVGDRLLLSPSGRPVRVRGIHAQNRPAETGFKGQRCAINLADVEKQEVRRGDWLLAPSLHGPTDRLDVRLRLLNSEKQALAHWTSVHVHIGAAHLTGRIALLNDQPLRPGESSYAQLVLEEPACAVQGDICILRDASAQRTIAGGRVLDAKPARRGRRSPERLKALAAWDQDEPKSMLSALLGCLPHGVDLAAFARNLGYDKLELRSLLTGGEQGNTVEISRNTGRERRYPDCRDASNPGPPWNLGSGGSNRQRAFSRPPPCRNDEDNLNSTILGGQGGGGSLHDDLLGLGQARLIEGSSPMLFSAERWRELGQGVLDHLAHEHESAPDSPGLNGEQLRLRLAPRIERKAFAVLLEELKKQGLCERQGCWWHLPGHAINLAAEDENLWSRISPLLKESPYQPPRVRDISRSEFLDEAAVRRLMMKAARAGRVYRIAHDHYFDRSAVAELAEIARSLASDATDGLVTAAQFRDRINTGRKLAIQILEFFDRTGLTRRLKDFHRLRDDGLAF